MPAIQGDALASTSSLSARPIHVRRLLSIDVYRGLTIAAMILVTDPGTYAYVYPQLSHSVWNGATLTDMIAPSFLFLVGVAMSFSFASRVRHGETRRKLAAHVVFRVTGLILLGLILNGFPDFNLHYLRIPGILQHIAVCLLYGGLLLAFTGRIIAVQAGERRGFRARWAVFAAVMIILVAADWVLMKWVPVPGYGAGHLDPFSNMSGFVDRSLFGTNHLWQWGNYWWDPDGMLTTLAASVNLMLGILAGEVLRLSKGHLRTVGMLFSSGVVFFLTGILLDSVFPVNKKIWTPSYTLLSGGFCLIVLALSHWILDWPWSERRASILAKITAPARVFGANAILAFIFSTVITTMASRIKVPSLDGHAQPIPQAMYEVFVQVLAPRNASLAFALLVVLLNLLLLIPFHRRGIFLKL